MNDWNSLHIESPRHFSELDPERLQTSPVRDLKKAVKRTGMLDFFRQIFGVSGGGVDTASWPPGYLGEKIENHLSYMISKCLRGPVRKLSESRKNDVTFRPYAR